MLGVSYDRLRVEQSIPELSRDGRYRRSRRRSSSASNATLMRRTA